MWRWERTGLPLFEITLVLVRLDHDWLLRSDIGKVIKTIVADEAFPDYAFPKKPTGRKERRQ
jgi:hypothetical protein